MFHDHCRHQNVGGVSLWAAVPHYLPGIANPVGARALLRVLSEMTDLSLDLDPLDGAIARFHQQLEEALRENDDLRRYVARLEQVAPPSQPPNNTNPSCLPPTS